MGNLTLFTNEDLGMEIRTLIIDGEPYFVGKDVASALGYADINRAVLQHVDKYDRKACSFKAYGDLVPSLWNNKNDFSDKVIINESGVYSLIFGSALPSAKAFKRWITSEVLPTIRKTGGYVNNDDLFIQTYFDDMDEESKIAFKQTLAQLRKKNEIIAKQKKEIIHKEDVIIGLVDEISLAEKRQVLNRVVRYKGANFKERWQELYRQFEMKYHLNLQLRLDNYNELNNTKIRKLDYIDKYLNKVPELYEIACKLYENDVKELVQQLYKLN